MLNVNVYGIEKGFLVATLVEAVAPALSNSTTNWQDASSLRKSLATETNTESCVAFTLSTKQQMSLSVTQTVPRVICNSSRWLQAASVLLCIAQTLSQRDVQ